jgi:hypothetical protein
MLTRFAIFFFVVLQLLSIEGVSQQSSFYYTQPQYKEYLSYLILSGKIDPRFHLVQPFHADELFEALNKDSTLNGCIDKMIRKDLQSYFPRGTNAENFITDMRLNVNSTKGKQWNASAGAGYQYGQFKLRYQHMADAAYPEDSAYFGTTGKLGRNNLSRANEAYLEWNSGNHALFLGRMNRNLGLINESGLLLSSNPFSFDHINYTFRNKHIHFMSLFTRLNDMNAIDIRENPIDTFPATRFMSVHRLDLRIHQKFMLGITESIIFGGKDNFPQFKYLNPANIFFFSKMNDRKSDLENAANSFLALDFYYKPAKRLTFFTQFLLDDMDFTRSLRKLYPDRIAIQSKLVLADVLPMTLFSMRYTKVSNWTYNSFYTWGNATFYGKSLGYPTHGSQEFSADFKSFYLSPFIMEVSLGAGRYRKQSLADPFPGTKSDFPIGQEEQFIKTRLSLSWFPNRNLSAGLFFDHQAIKNHQNIVSQKLNLLTLGGHIQFFGIFDMLKNNIFPQALNPAPR